MVERPKGAERNRTAESFRAGVIYAIQAESGGPVKIGFCHDPGGVASRLRALQTGNPYKLRVAHTEAGSSEDERDLHRAFRQHRLVGEWFTPSAELCRRLPGVLYTYEPVTPQSVAYDRGFEDGWERGFDDAAPCEDCGDVACDCPDTPATLRRLERIESTMAQQRFRALHGSTRGMGRTKGARLEDAA